MQQLANLANAVQQAAQALAGLDANLQGLKAAENPCGQPVHVTGADALVTAINTHQQRVAAAITAIQADLNQSATDLGQLPNYLASRDDNIAAALPAGGTS